MYDFSQLCGIIPPLLTQFTDNDQVDHRAIERHVDFLVQKGVDALFVCGSNAEFMTLSIEERQNLSETVYQTVNHRIPLIVHITASSLSETLQLASHAAKLGVEAISLMPPWYYAYDENEIFSWINSVIHSVPDTPILLYNIPQCNGNDLKPEWIAKWREIHPNIIGVKNSQEDVARIVTYTQWSNFNFLVGSDQLYLYTLMNGGRGAVSGLANILPEPYTRLRDAYRQGDFAAALQIQQKINVFSQRLHGADFSYLKAGLELRQLGSRQCRAPRKTLDDATVSSWSKIWAETEPLR